MNLTNYLKIKPRLSLIYQTHKQKKMDSHSTKFTNLHVQPYARQAAGNCETTDRYYILYFTTLKIIHLLSLLPKKPTHLLIILYTSSD